MKKIIFVILTVIALNGKSQESCDSAMFYKLYYISQKKNIENSDFLLSLKLLDSLEIYRNCDHVIILPDSIYTCLTYTFGRICLKVNNELSIKSFMTYRLKHNGSAEELLCFTFENLFVVKPDVILREISKKDSTLQKFLLNDLIWGFINNRYYGVNDPFAYNPFKAMTYYKIKPEIVLTSINYKNMFYKVNPKTKEFYKLYSGFYDYILAGIYNELIFQEEKRKELNNSKR